jgi:hypothetical protein
MLGLLGNFGQMMPQAEGILGTIGEGVRNNSNALIGIGLGLMSGPRSTAMPAAIEGMYRGAVVDQRTQAMRAEQIAKAAEYQRQVAQAKALGLPDIFAGNEGLINRLAADRYGPKTPAAPREVSFTERQFNMLSEPEQAAYRRRQFLGEGEGKVQAAPSGYRYKPDGSLEPIPGGPAVRNEESGGSMTVSQKNDLVKTETAARELFADLDNHVKLVETHRSGTIPGTAKDALGGSTESVRGALRKAKDMGVPNLHDLPVLEKMFPSPTVDIMDHNTYGNAISTEARAKSAADQLKKRVLDGVNAQRASVGLPPKTAAELSMSSDASSTGVSGFNPFGGASAPSSGGYIVKRLSP